MEKKYISTITRKLYESIKVKNSSFATKLFTELLNEYLI